MMDFAALKVLVDLIVDHGPKEMGLRTSSDGEWIIAHQLLLETHESNPSRAVTELTDVYPHLVPYFTPMRFPRWGTRDTPGIHLSYLGFFSEVFGELEKHHPKPEKSRSTAIQAKWAFLNTPKPASPSPKTPPPVVGPSATETRFPKPPQVKEPPAQNPPRVRQRGIAAKTAKAEKEEPSPYSWRCQDKRLLIVPSELRRVREIEALVRPNVTLQSIADQMNAQGYRYRGGVRWRAEHVRDIVDNNDARWERWFEENPDDE